MAALTGKNKAYQSLLARMLIIENVGEVLYGALITKVKNANLKSAYEKLALNERETAKHIERELLARDENNRVMNGRVILSFTKFICGILTARQLAWLLKTALDRRIYSRWYDMHKDENHEFWRLLLNHENLQHELLKPFRGS